MCVELTRTRPQTIQPQCVWRKKQQKWPWVRALASGAVFASGQTRNVDLQACAAVQMWNQRASVMVYPLVCKSTVSSPHPPPGLPPTPPNPLLSFHLATPPPPPPSAPGARSIPAGPCLFISSEAAMINEALNTSSLSPGPGEPPQLSKQAQAAVPPRCHHGPGPEVGRRRKPPTTSIRLNLTAGSNSRDLSQLFSATGSAAESRDILRCKKANKKQCGSQWVKGKTS